MTLLLRKCFHNISSFFFSPYFIFANCPSMSNSITKQKCSNWSRMAASTRGYDITPSLNYCSCSHAIIHPEYICSEHTLMCHVLIFLSPCFNHFVITHASNRSLRYFQTHICGGLIPHASGCYPPCLHSTDPSCR
jgi:hypothetical protein